MSDQAETAIAPQPSIEDRLVAAMGGKSVAKPAPAAAPEPQVEAEPEAADPPADDVDQVASDEVTAEDLPAEDDEPQSTVDALVIEHNGERKRLSRAEARELAQKGYDYTQKTQQLADERTRVQMMAQALQQTAQMQAALVEDVGDFKALQRELARFPQSPEAWMKVSQDDPLGAFQQRTQYDALVGALNAKVSQIQQKQSQLSQSQGQISAEQLRQEFAKVTERIPAWKDPEAFKRDSQGIRNYLLAEGYSEQEVNSLADARALTVAQKAWKYDQLLKAKGDKLKQVRQAPPVVRPGSAQSESVAQRGKYDDARSRLKKSGSLDDAAAVFYQRLRKK